MNRLLLVLVLGFCIKFVSAYEVDTHALMTARAVDRSILLSSDLAGRMGWDRYDDGKIFGVPNGINFDNEMRGAYFDPFSHREKVPAGRMRVLFIVAARQDQSLTLCTLSYRERDIPAN